ncbi:MAG: hypothetical protein HJJLKODD_01034 [Phycisphaerae bacterium]|nr:hypothetical protein [Phycisphaerae bacterium]
MSKQTWQISALWMALLCGWPITLLAQTTTQPAAPLAAKEEMVRDRLRRLEDQMFRLADKLRTTDPQQAEKLEAALRQMSQLGLRERVDQLVLMLSSDSDLSGALTRQDQLLKDLREVLTELVAQPDESADRENQIKQLQEWLAQTSALIRDQEQVQQQTQNMADTGDTPLDTATAQKLEKLIAAQQELQSRTQASAEAAAGADAELTAAQQQLANETEQLAKLLEKEQREDETQSALQAAQKAMQQAAQDIQNGQRALAGDTQEDALQELRRALAKLTKKKNESADLQALSAAQKQLADSAQQLAQQMQAAEQSAQTQATGDQVQQAGGQMQQAGEQLQQQQPDTAQSAQQQALEQLRQAQQRLQEQLDQLRREQQRAKLEQLQKLYTRLRDEETAIRQKTIELQQRWPTDPRRTDLQQAEQLGRDQLALADVAGQAVQLLMEDGTTLVLHHLAAGVQNDMQQVAKWLQNALLESTTQLTQQEIIDSINDILEAIDSALQPENSPAKPGDQQGNQQNQSGEPPPPPLLPSSAELKLLYNLQERIFDRTREVRHQPAINSATADWLTNKQQTVLELAKEMHNRMTEQGFKNMDQPD